MPWLIIGLIAVIALMNSKGALLDIIDNGKPCSELPDAPTPEPPVERRMTELDPKVQARAIAALGYIQTRLGQLLPGTTATVTETYRAPGRQRWLWGICREYKAPGRTGTVTNIKGASGKHPQRKAFDLRYTTTANGAELRSALETISDEVEEKYGFSNGYATWGWDIPHWEDFWS